MFLRPLHLTTIIPKPVSIRRFLTSQRLDNKFDVIIAGGGLVGTTLACTLGKNFKLANKRILLLEGSKQNTVKLSSNYSNRVSALNPGTKKLLTKIGAWQHIEFARYGTGKKIQVWDGASDAFIVFKPDNICNDVAYIVENDLVLSTVGKVLQDINNVEILYEAKISKYQLPDQDQNCVQVELENGTKYTCNLLLGCDGANSQVRKAMGVNYLNWNYEQVGLVATLNLEESEENDCLWQRFLTAGIVALLPLEKNVSSLVWCTTPEHANKLLHMPEEEFVDSLNKAIWSSGKQNNAFDVPLKVLDNVLKSMNCSSDDVRQYPGKIIGCEEKSRAVFPLGFGHATNYIGKGVVLVGDAAHRIHPLAGQGVNLGFGDITCLDKVLGDAVYSGSREDDMQYLKEYETERQRHNIPTMMAVEGLYRLYNTENVPLVLLRSLGIQLTHSMSPLKKLIMAQAAT